jgi:TPP-dependent pyruvate/acetoin dehydrogenase alpha subunit
MRAGYRYVMQRYPAFDPPEYVSWSPDPELLEAYRSRIAADAARAAVVAELDEATLLGLYTGLVRFRLHDYALKRWVKRGVISKAWLGTGEEAATIGCVHALRRGPNADMVAPMIRNAGACHEMGMSLESLFSGYLGTADGPNGGFDVHVGDASVGVVQPISHVGEMVPVMAGIALSFQQRGEARVALTWIGDGATKTAAVHEGLNLAAVLKVPAIYVIQNNQVALGTRLAQHQAGDFREWPAMYGMHGAVADGNNVLDVYAATRLAAERARAGAGPTLLLVETFRMGGHATHDEAESRETFDAALFDYWGRRDPIGLFEQYLQHQGVDAGRLEQIELRVAAEIDDAAERALAAREDRMPAGSAAEYAGVSAGVRQPGLAARLEGL